MKAKLEIEMPENCLECGLSYKKIIHNVGTFYECQALGEEVDCAGREKTQRYRGCPLKIIMDKSISIMINEMIQKLEYVADVLGRVDIKQLLEKMIIELKKNQKRIEDDPEAVELLKYLKSKYTVEQIMNTCRKIYEQYNEDRK